jgi:hypothetical protein
MGIKYNRTGDFCTIVIKDSSDNIIFKRRINLMNKTEYFDVMYSIADKYGFKAEIDLGKDVNSKEKAKEELKKELDWMNSK